jgi:hypothetical protein
MDSKDLIECLEKCNPVYLKSMTLEEWVNQDYKGGPLGVFIGVDLAKGKDYTACQHPDTPTVVSQEGE